MKSRNAIFAAGPLFTKFVKEFQADHISQLISLNQQVFYHLWKLSY